MTRPQALMEAVSANLNWFLQPISANLSKPQEKFLRDGLIGLLRAGRPVVCRMPDELDFLLYRLVTELTEAMTTCVHLGRALP